MPSCSRRPDRIVALTHEFYPDPYRLQNLPRRIVLQNLPRRIVLQNLPRRIVLQNQTRTPRMLSGRKLDETRKTTSGGIEGGGTMGL